MSAVTPDERQRVGLAFGAALRTARLACGLTHEGLAEASGLDPSFLSLLERGVRTPTIAVAFRLSAALGFNPLRLVVHTALRIYSR
jgi:transcriptional regulator with XRE-family HTH domain